MNPINRSSANLPVSQAHLTASQLTSLADQVLKDTKLTEWTHLIPVEQCHALLAVCSSSSLASDQEALNLARSLMALYRKADFEDPDIFSTALCAVFAAYPASIGRQAIDPVKGLPGRLKFVPSIAEVKQALDECMIRRRAIGYRAQWMLDERKRREDEAAKPKIPQARRDEMANMFRAMGEKMLTPEARKDRLKSRQVAA